MTKKILPLFALAALLTACSASAQNITATDEAIEPLLLGEAPAPAAAYVAPEVGEPTFVAEHEAAITCDVRARRTGDGMLIQARAFADRDIDGEYDLHIVKSSAGGDAEISQSGPLVLQAGYAATLGENEISIERGARVRAVLTLYDASGEVCRRTFRL
ncbi:MAG: curli-like amyloid fiber formation chaperone CsgH [Hyphomonadaceae bacterium]